MDDAPITPEDQLAEMLADQFVAYSVATGNFPPGQIPQPPPPGQQLWAWLVAWMRFVASVNTPLVPYPPD